ncbi:MAG: peptidase T [Lachnospiraceae bacterium]|nr:peptidase T [Lachnospiraceae bacterium]
MSDVLERFLRYVKIDTQSDEDSGLSPSTAKQHDLARILYEELKDMGASDLVYDTEHCYVYAKIPANDGGEHDKTLGFVSHMDTSPDAPGSEVKPRIIHDYDGADIVLNEEKDIVLKTEIYPEICEYKGQTLIVTDGTTLLGADDKAGISEIMTMAQILLSDPSIKHGTIAIAFTPDEEIGEGTRFFDKSAFGADYAYTVDGGGIGELEYETFNGAAAKISIEGVSVHPGEARDKMVNAARIAAEFDSMLPAKQRPENTKDREGFFHMTDISGDVEKAEVCYIIRDHDRTLFENKKRLIEDTVNQLSKKYPRAAINVVMKDQYYNMREKIEPDHMFLVDNARKCMTELDIEPKIQPIRGGTDGATLSYMGIPCPNLCTGGHNYHGRFEYCCLESMEKIVKLLIKLTEEKY